MSAWGIGPLLIAFGIGYQLCYQIEAKVESDCKPVAHHERNLSPHEQQPDPIPAVIQGWLDVERWIL